ncbi:MAG: hypothetical protein ACKV2T_18875 [Kofleriaceae bacterium]
MSEYVLKPKEEEIEAKVPDVQFENLTDELAGAVKAEGEENVTAAVLEVQAGIAQPEALLQWIDDLRDPEEQHQTEDDNLERSFTMDFIPDTARDNAATENPPGDDYMFFSANRRGPFGGDDDEGGGGGGGGGGGDGEGEGDKPADPKAPKKSAGAGEPARAAPKDTKPAPKKPEPPPGGNSGGKK